MRKALNRFEPSARKGREESERYYAEVHTRLAQDLLVQQEGIVVYTQIRVERQYDDDGSWGRQPTAWRFVSMTSRPVDAERAGTTSVATGSEIREALARSNVNCLRELRRALVEEKVLFDRVRGQTCFAAFLFEYDRFADSPAAEAHGRFADITERLSSGWPETFGLRRVLANTVLSESKAIPIEEPGQQLTDELLVETTKVGYLQFYFDDPVWGERYFERPEVRKVLVDPSFAVANGYHVSERCCFDKR